MTVVINSRDTSTDDPCWLAVESWPDGLRIEVMVDGQTVGLDLDAEGAAQLRRAIEDAACRMTDPTSTPAGPCAHAGTHLPTGDSQ